MSEKSETKLKIKLNDSLIKAFQILGSMTDEADIKIDKEGIHVFEDCFAGQLYAKLECKIKSKDSDSFRVNVQKLSKILNLIKKDKAELESDEGFLTIIIGNRHFSLAKMMEKNSAEGVEKLLERLEVVTEAEIVVSDFFEKLKEAKLMSELDSIYIGIDKDGFNISSSNENKSQYNAKMKLKLLKFEEGKSKYSYDLMKKIFESDFLTGTVQFTVGDNKKDYIMRLIFEEDDIVFTAILTPRVLD